MSRMVFYRVREPGPSGPAVFVLRLLVTATGLWLASRLVPGIEIRDWQSLVAGTAIFTLVNMLVRPVALALSCCLVMATFGLFVIVINAAMLAATAWAGGQLGLNFEVGGFWDAVVGALIISAVSIVASLFIGPRLRRA